jgi:protein DGCR14
MDLAQATPRTRAALTRQQQQLVKHIQGKPERSINRQDVLTEEEYVEALEKIIARDFFPLVSERLKQREQEQEILAGFHSQDPDVIERSVRHMEHLASQDPAWSSRIGRRNVQDTPRYGADTPSGRSIYGETPVALDPGRSSAAPLRYNSDLSLDTFQSQYTSEDNASFADIMEQENAARKTRYAWAYKAEHNASDKSQRAIEARQQLVDLSRRLAEGDSEVRLIEGSEPGRPGQRLLIEGRTTLPGDTASLEFAKRRVIAAAPKQERLMIEGASNSSARQEQLQERETQLTLALSEQKDAIDKARQESEIGTGVTAWPFTARNNFYYAPDANIPIQDTSKQSLPQPSGSKSASDSLGSIAPKGIRYNMTRLIDDDDLDEQARRAGVPPSPSHSNIAAAISGTPCRSECPHMHQATTN